MIFIRFSLSIVIRRTAENIACLASPELIDGGRKWGPVIEGKPASDSDWLADTGEDADRWADRTMQEIRRLS